MMLSSTMQKVFFGTIGPLVALVCFALGIICLYRGLRMLLRRSSSLLQGLHACSVLPRHHLDGRTTYVPVFSYTGRNGEELDIMGDEEFSTEQSALCARRSVVYTSERPDAGVARNAFCYMLLPVFLLILGVAGLVASHYLLQLVPN